MTTTPYDMAVKDYRRMCEVMCDAAIGHVSDLTLAVFPTALWVDVTGELDDDGGEVVRLTGIVFDEGLTIHSGDNFDKLYEDLMDPLDFLGPLDHDSWYGKHRIGVGVNEGKIE